MQKFNAMIVYSIVRIYINWVSYTLGVFEKISTHTQNVKCLLCGMTVKFCAGKKF